MIKLIINLFALLIILVSVCDASANKKYDTQLDVALKTVSAISETIHFLQQERGASCGYISSNGKQFGSKLEKIKINSDREIENLRNNFDNHKEKLKLYFTKKDIVIIFQTLKDISTTRKDIISLSTNFSKVYSKYTQTIAFLLLKVSEISDMVKDDELSNAFYRYSILLMNKESIGQKRASLSSLFSQKEFDREIFEYFVTSDTQEKIYLKVFLHTATEDIKKNYNDIIKSTTFKIVDEYEKLAKDKLTGIKVEVDVKKWFDIITQKVNLVQGIEHKLFQDISRIIDKLNSKVSVLFNKSEKRWLNKKETITYVYDPDWAPFEWSNGINAHTGIIADILKMISEKSGIVFNPVYTKTWAKAVELAQSKQVDMYSAVPVTSKRKEYMDFTDSYIFQYYGGLVSKENDHGKYQDLSNDLKDKVIGITKGNAIGNYMRKTYPSLHFVDVKSTNDGFMKLRNNKIDIFAINVVTASYFINHNKYNDMKIVSKLDYMFGLKIAISKDKSPYIISILNKTLKSIGKERLEQVYKKWVNDKKNILFTKSEQKYIKTQTAIKYVYDPHREPFEYQNDLGVHSGVTSKILNLITQKSRLKFEAINTKDWEESVSLIRDKKADMFSFVIENDKRKEYMNFTNKVLFKVPVVFVTNSDDEDIYENVKFDLKNKRIGIVKNRAIYKKLLVKFPDFDFIELSSIFDGYKQLSQGKIDILAVNKSTAKYYIKIKGYKNTKIVTSIDVYFNFKIALQKTLPKEVLSIMNKTLNSISEQELNNIYNSIMSVKVDKEVNWVLMSQIGGVILLGVLFILWNNRKLQITVTEKTKDILEQNQIAQSLNRELEESEYELQLLNESLEYKIDERTKDLENAKKEVEAIHKHTQDSIEYASLIQGALIPEKGVMSPFFKDHFVTWTPKDTVGGDIWLFNELRHEDECLLFFIDCTGHGVPGAFVTMIVKAIEREIVANVSQEEDTDISPAMIMEYFNKTMKKLLRQESADSLSNAGWDGGIIYYNKRTQILKFAGAETPLFYMDNDNNLHTIKGNRYSVGYKKCDANYVYKETIIEVEEGMKFYCTTDGYLDQNGGEKDFPFGKKRFKKIIQDNSNESMAELQTILQMEMMEYENCIEDNDRNDDMTVIAFEIDKKSLFKKDKIEEIVKYEGVMTQNIIASCMDNIEAKILHMGAMGVVSTITIEYCQNMMNYSKNEDIDSLEIVPAGTIEVQFINSNQYEIVATNIVSLDDKNKIEPKLIEIQSLDKKGIKKRYRELRKSGQNTHEKGGGIGMYEIAKVSDMIEYGFVELNKNKFHFTMKSIVKAKKEDTP